MIDQDEIIKEVAVRNNVLLGANDPLLQTVTIFEKALEQSISTLNEQNEAHQRAFSLALAQSVEESKKIGEKIIAQGADYVSKQAKEAVTSALDEGVSKMNKTEKEAVSAEIKVTKLYFFVYGSGFGVVMMVLASILGRAF